MMINEIRFKPIGIIHSPFKKPQGVPIQPEAGKEVKGTVEVFPQYARGLLDLEGFSHIVLIYYFHLSKGFSLEVKPYLDEKLRGVFATRAPSRPNSIGISVVRLLKREKQKLFIQNLDIVDGTPLLDIKPYVPEFDKPEKIKIGWLRKRVKKLNRARDDGRFIK